MAASTISPLTSLICMPTGLRSLRQPHVMAVSFSAPPRSSAPLRRRNSKTRRTPRPPRTPAADCQSALEPVDIILHSLSHCLVGQTAVRGFHVVFEIIHSTNPGDRRRNGRVTDDVLECELRPGR